MIDLKHLPNCHPDEKLVYFLRRHPVTLLGVVMGYVAVLLLPLLAGTMLATQRPDILHDPVLFPLIALGGSLFWLYAWLFLFQAFLDYYLDIWVVTNRRIINITQSGLFHRQVSELRLYRVQDATASIGGFLHTFLNFGTVEIQTAGEKSRFVFDDIPDPQEITKTILRLAEHDRSSSIGAVMEELELEAERRPSQRP